MLQRIWDVTFTVSNLEKAVEFYENVLGLSKKYHFPKNYAGFDCGGVEIGLLPGTPQRSREEMPCVNFQVEDVGESFRTLCGRGVHFIKEPQNTAWGGRIARFTDPDGNMLQLTQIDWRKYFTICAQG
ncbi:MAG: VOC family protein [Anaerolineales bacterium]|nr:VOC family protein [Anaerolineales bacterium]